MKITARFLGPYARSASQENRPRHPAGMPAMPPRVPQNGHLAPCSSLASDLISAFTPTRASVPPPGDNNQAREAGQENEESENGHCTWLLASDDPPASSRRFEGNSIPVHQVYRARAPYRHAPPTPSVMRRSQTPRPLSLIESHNGVTTSYSCSTVRIPPA